jgi:hypothetical protein
MISRDPHPSNAPIESVLRLAYEGVLTFAAGIPQAIPNWCIYFGRRGTEILDWAVSSCHTRSRWSLQTSGSFVPVFLARPHQPVNERPRNKRPPPRPWAAPRSEG